MHVYCLCTTYNRNSCLERAIRCFLEQDYKEKCTLLIFNSGAETKISVNPEELEDNKKIILINRDKSLSTGQDYTSVGQKYIDVLTYCNEADVITSFDCDDIFLPSHISCGVIGIQEAYLQGKLAYKPKYSYFKSIQGITRMENVFEPSIFVDADYLRSQQYYELSVKYHDKWVLPLVTENKIYVNKEGESTLIYDWSGELKVYKMSGKPEHPSNFYMSQNTEKDTGTGLTKPITKEQIAKYYSEIQFSNFINS